MKKIVLIFALVLSGLSMNSCKKKSTTPTTTIPTTIDTTKNTVNNTSNLLCDGTTKNEYMPLKSGNSWVYSNTFFDHYDLKDSMEYNSKNYYKNGESYSYYGMDPITKDVYYYSGYSQLEYMMIPANPNLNQTWEFPNKMIGTTIEYRKVTNLNATTKTSKCTYKNTLEVSIYSDSNFTKLVGIYYYKKGLGLVNMYESNGLGGFSYNSLESVVIK